MQGGEEGELQQRPREALAQGAQEGSLLPEELLRGAAQAPVQPAVPLRHVWRLPRRLQEPLRLGARHHRAQHPQPRPAAPRPQPQPYLLLHHAAPALRHAPQPARRLRHRPGQRLLVPALLPACQAQPGLSAAPHAVPAARPRGGSATSPPVPQGPLQGSPRLQPRAHGPSEGSPSLTRCPRLLRLGAAGVHVHQELGQEPHAGAEGVAAGRGARGRLPAPQVLAQQPGQGADAAGVCGAAGLRAGARGRGSAGRGASGYLGW